MTFWPKNGKQQVRGRDDAWPMTSSRFGWRRMEVEKIAVDAMVLSCQVDCSGVTCPVWEEVECDDGFVDDSWCGPKTIHGNCS